MFMKTNLKPRAFFSLLLVLLFSSSMFFTACDSGSSDDNDSTQNTDDGDQSSTTAKYVFMFIGDGMSEAQVNATEIYKAAIIDQADADYINSPSLLNMSQLNATGFATTYDAGTYITDSASAGTALACGHKTLSGVIGLAVDKVTSYKTIAEKAKEAGMKIGVISSVSLDHATPASYYAHIDSRNKYSDIVTQLTESDFDYFAGGGFLASGSMDVEAAAEAEGYTYVDLATDGRTAFNAISAATGKVIAVNGVLDSSKALPYELVRDTSNDADMSLAEFTEKGIEVLENDNGFFMMVEGGKVDWACHANDAKAAIIDMIAFDNAIAKALEFYESHPDETLIIVTGDHDCGGLSIGFAGTKYATAFTTIESQSQSYDTFNTAYNNTAYFSANSVTALTDLYEEIEESFGLDMNGDGDASMQVSAYQLSLLENAFDAQVNGTPSGMSSDEYYLLYGGYNPLTVTITHVLNQKAGIAWTSYSHTGVPVPVFAKGVGEDSFNGYYDNTDVCKKIDAAMGLDLF